MIIYLSIIKGLCVLISHVDYFFIVLIDDFNARGKYDYFAGEQISISPLCKGNECLIPPGQRFGELSPCLTKVHQFHCPLPNEIFWPSLFTKLLFWNISGVIFTNMENRYMTKARQPALNLENFE